MAGWISVLPVWLLLPALIASSAVAAERTVRVVRVVDGDSLEVAHAGQGVEKVRLYGVDAPEYLQAGGKAARAGMVALIRNQAVRIRTLDVDQYGRSVILARLSDGRILNEELVRLGHAWVYRDHCLESWCPAWLVLEKEARQCKRGLWAEKNPVPPWKWRRKNR